MQSDDNRSEVSEQPFHDTETTISQSQGNQSTSQYRTEFGCNDVILELRPNDIETWARCQPQAVLLLLIAASKACRNNMFAGPELADSLTAILPRHHELRMTRGQYRTAISQLVKGHYAIAKRVGRRTALALTERQPFRVIEPEDAP